MPAGPWSWLNIPGMSDSIFLLGDDGVLTEVSIAPYDAEAELQELLEGHVDLLPGAQINRDSPRRWLLVKREAGIPPSGGRRGVVVGGSSCR